MVTNKEKLQRLETLSKSLSNVSFGLNFGTFTSALMAPGTYTYLGFLGLNVGCMTANHFIKKQIENYDENGYITEINKIYSDIIDDAIKLSIELDNKELIEHFVLIKTLYNNGYLSFNSNNLSLGSVEDEIRMIGALSLNGHGVCRNASVLTKDFFNGLGYKSQVLVGHLGTDLDMIISKIVGIYVEEAKRTGKTISEEKKEILAEKIRQAILENQEQKNREVDGETEKSLFGNHAITKVNDDNNSYYLDVQRHSIYSPCNDTLLSLDGETFDICKFNNTYSKKLFKTRPIKDKEVLDLARMKSLLIDADKKISDNLDMLEEFNKEHKDQLERAEEIYRLKRVQ